MSTWEQIEFRSGGAVQGKDTPSIDLGGTAKGLAIDLAVEAMLAADANGGLVNIGGDIRCFGRRADGCRRRGQAGPGRRRAKSQRGRAGNSVEC